jgi:membrane protease YdiL (CAAX protease family)
MQALISRPRPVNNVRSVFKFFILTFILSWLLWIASAAILGWDLSRTSALAPISGGLYLLGVFAPALVAIALTAQSNGRAGTLALLSRTIKYSVPARWYIFAVAYFGTIKLTLAVVYRLTVGAWPNFTEIPWFLMLAGTVVSTPFQAGEEIGWRGYALPRLSSHMGLPLASIILGVVWACWHLPFFFLSGTDKSGQSFPLYLLAVTAISVSMAWLYWRTNGSLLLTMLMHSAVNNTNIVPTPTSTAANVFTLRASLVSWLTVLLIWLCGGYFLARMRRASIHVEDQDKNSFRHPGQQSLNASGGAYSST